MIRKSKYDDVVLIGSESFVLEILRRLIDLRTEWGYDLSYFQYNSDFKIKIDNLCSETGVNYECFHGNGKALENRLSKCLNQTLIISVRNTYLFPETIVKKDNIDIINFHSALLPKYPGRNSSSWAIYNGERVSGLTWHWVNAGVDTGNILWQGECPIGEDTKAYELLRSIEEKGLEGFLKIICDVLTGTAKSQKQHLSLDNRKIYLSSEVPGNGRFSLDDDPLKIYRLLRCLDYGPNPIFPLPRTEIDNVGSVEITGYKKVKRGDYTTSIKQRLILPLGNEYELILKYREVGYK